MAIRQSVLVMGLLMVITGPGEAVPAYTFTLQGRSFEPRVFSLNGTPAKPQAGDVISIDNLNITLGAPGVYAFTRTRDHRLLLGKAVVGVWITPDVLGPGRIKVNDPLHGMSDTQLRQMRGVHTECWSPEVERELVRLDPDIACISVDNGFIEQAAPPRLPERIEYLCFRQSKSPATDIFREMHRYRSLKFFRFSFSLGQSVVAAELSPTLRYLQTVRVTDLGALSRLTQLRVLDLAWTPPEVDLPGQSRVSGVQDLGFVSGLNELRLLDVSRTQAEDLSPLASLPHIETVSAELAPVRVLPQRRVATLRSLQLMGCPVADGDVAKMQAANPDCHILHHWMAAFADAVRGTTRVRVRSGGSDEAGDKQSTLYIETDPKAIAKLISSLEIDEAHSTREIMTSGDPSLEFYAGHRLLAALSIEFNRWVRWPGGWPTDGALTPKSSQALLAWFNAHHVQGPEHEVDAENDRMSAMRRKLDRVSSGMPTALVATFQQGPKQFQDVLQRELPQPADQAVQLYHMLGAENGVWYGWDPIDQFASKLLQHYPGDVLRDAADHVLAGSDRIAQRGVARMWLFAGLNALDEGDASALASRRLAVLNTLIDARSPERRGETLLALYGWSDDISPEHAAHFVKLALTDPDAQIRQIAMLVAGRLGLHEVEPELIAVLRHQPISYRTVPEDLAEDDGVTNEEVDTIHFSVEDTAALALGWLSSKDRQELVAGLPPTNATAVAFALLGQPQKLQPQHFVDDRNLQTAAVEAVVRCHGRYCLKEAIYCKETHCNDGDHFAMQITQMLLADKAPGGEILQTCTTQQRLQEWYRTYGADYVKHLQQ